MRKIDYEGKPHEVIAGASIFRTRKGQGGKSIREVLLVKGRNSQKWYFPGGKIREGEDIVEGLRREMKEEIGVEFSGEIRARGDSVGYYHFAEKDFAIANFVLEGELSRAPKAQQEDNVEEVGWFADPFKLDLTFQTRAVLEEQMSPKAQNS